jgi:hypothetical protein
VITSLAGLARDVSPLWFSVAGEMAAGKRDGMDIERTLDTLLDIEEDRLVSNDSVETVLRILLDRRGDGFRARIGVSDGSIRLSAAGKGALPALAVSSAAQRLQRRLERHRS